MGSSQQCSSELLKTGRWLLLEKFRFFSLTYHNEDKNEKKSFRSFIPHSFKNNKNSNSTGNILSAWVVQWKDITYLELHSSNSSVAAEISSTEARTNGEILFTLRKTKLLNSNTKQHIIMARLLPLLQVYLQRLCLTIYLHTLLSSAAYLYSTTVQY